MDYATYAVYEKTNLYGARPCAWFALLNDAEKFCRMMNDCWVHSDTPARFFVKSKNEFIKTSETIL